MSRRHTADVVLGGLPAVEDDEVDAALGPTVLASARATPDAERRPGTVLALRFRASDVAAATGGALVGDDVEVDGASFDTRGRGVATSSCLVAVATVTGSSPARPVRAPQR